MKPRSAQQLGGVLDLFCGIGGLSLGLKRGGLHPIGAADCWEEALATFRRNSDVPAVAVDLTAVMPADLLKQLGISAMDIDVIAGGPPCQGFSTVGKREAKDPRNMLWRRLLQIVDHVRPAYVIIENVEGLVVADRGRLREQIQRAFGDIGYHMKSKLLTAADYGVPQLRKRVFFLGWLGGVEEPHFPSPTCSKHISVSEAIFDLPALASGEAKSEYACPAMCGYQQARRGRSRMVRNHEAANHPADLVRILKHIPDGGNRQSIPAELQPRSGFHNSYSRLASWKPAIAVTSNMRKPSSSRATHPTQPRGLTVREGLRLQSFDDSFEVLGSRTSQYLQVGNAVPPLLAEAIGRGVATALQATGTKRVRQARRGKSLSVGSPGELFSPPNRSRPRHQPAGCP
jgi:DNA (cytosine-5)-methyltransferase 1